ncbi:serine/threonine-protein kinase Sgk1-like isoform X2 [Centruroides sculpturatus]|uniref:serine/threonine-protein kinase Sgk1-like isoform X2 n=1 Tax=Centruroides sculpturatus TaxID=218467 RepID=UPI000C6D4CB4|nr:serine/threonine-protein kinase Sgk1-like isoform X2 [Centruroides sculpturatus]
MNVHDLRTTECGSLKQCDSQLQTNDSKKNGNSTEFCRNIFQKMLCCCRKQNDTSDSHNCGQENKLSDTKLNSDHSSKRKRNIIGEYEIIKEIGNGHFGVVYLARPKNSDEQVALKVIKKKECCHKQLYKITREHTAWSCVSTHPHIVRLITFFEINTSFCFVSDYIDGQNLTNFLRNNGPLVEIKANIIAAQVASAIMYIHDKRIIHRDISSNNIMLDDTKGAQLIDFGLCTFDLNPKEFCGTLSYLCPEILQGKPYDAYCDWWAFGVVLYQMLIGKTPMRIYAKRVMNIEDPKIFSHTKRIRIAQEVELLYPIQLSKYARKIIEDLLQKDPSKRLRETDIRRHKFFDNVPWPEIVHNV